MVHNVYRVEYMYSMFCIGQSVGLQCVNSELDVLTMTLYVHEIEEREG